MGKDTAQCFVFKRDKIGEDLNLKNQDTQAACHEEHLICISQENM